MQSLEVISVNIWQILISLINLLLIFLIVKRFLFKPVKKALDARKAQIDKQYDMAEEANKKALDNQKEWETKMSNAQSEADDILKTATDKAKLRSEKIIDDAKSDAESIMRQAKSEAELEKKKAEDDIKRQIVDVSSELTKKLLEREITNEDHEKFIDSFIGNIGESDDGDK